MKTLSQLKEEVKSLMKGSADIDAQCTNDNRGMTEAEKSLKNEILDKVEELEAEIKVREREERISARLEQPVSPPLSRPKPSPVEVGDRPKDRFRSFGEQLSAVIRASTPGGSADPRLFNAASGLGESVNSDGGFLVQTDFSATILQNMWENAAIPSRLRRITVSGNSNGMTINGLDETSRADGSRAGGIQSYWTGEAVEKTGSKPKFRQIELKLNKLTGLCYATDELLEDASALESVITDGFNKEFDFKITDSVLNGTGVGQPLGVLNSGCLTTVAKESGQANDTIVYENIVNMWSRIMASSRANSVWLINQDCEPQLHMMSLAVGTGGVPVYMPAGGASQLPYSTLYGRPVLPIEQCSTLGDLGDIILADFSNYIFIDKGGLKKDVSIHVRFVYDESVFRFVYRCDGQPVLASEITPYKGTNTLSHFVTLAAR